MTGRLVLRAVVATAVVVLVFAFVLPRTAEYRDAWDAVASMGGDRLALLALAGGWNLATYWPVLVAGLPGLRWREAAVVNQASTAVANTVPAGGAVAVAVTFRILRDWGFTAQSVTNQVLVTGVWNQLVKLVLPVVAVLVAWSVDGVQGSAVGAATQGLVVLALVVGAGALALRSDATTAVLGSLVDGAWVGLRRLVLRVVPGSWSARLGWQPARDGMGAVERWLRELRSQLLWLLRESTLRLSAAAVISHLSLYLVLLAAIRAVGIADSDLSWSKILLGFALVRWLSAVPITPGGVGIVELGYVGFLATGAASGLESELAGAVLVFRAITYVLPIAFGAVAWVVYRRAESWRRPPDTRGVAAMVAGTS